jgi:NADPH-dependent curcumin reductase
MGALDVVELERARERIEDRLGDAAGIAALEPRVVVDADACEQRDLFATQPGDAPQASEGRQARLLRRDPRTSGRQEPAHLALGVHARERRPLRHAGGFHEYQEHFVRTCLRRHRIVTATNHQIRLARRPEGLPTADDWSLGEAELPEPGPGEFVVRVSHISIDPAMRAWMNPVRSYIAPVEIDAVMRAGGVGEVVASQHSGFDVGEHVSGVFGVQEYALSDGQGVVKLDLSLAPAQSYLGVLGFPGLTAYFGLLDVGKMQRGDVVVISGAAGAVGSVAGQIAKLHGCRVIGIAGGEQKCRWLVDELGFDGAIDYKADDVRAKLKEYAPDGVDVFFDNVGGDILDTVMLRLARGARVVICGAVSQYNATDRPRGATNYMQLLVARASMTGFVVFDWAERFPEAVGALAGWLARGELIAKEDIVHGSISEFPDTLLKLFRGENVGKLVLALDRAQ